MKVIIKPIAAIAIASIALASGTTAYADTPHSFNQNKSDLEGLPSDLAIMTDEEMGQIQGEMIPLYAFGVCMSSLPCSMAVAGFFIGGGAVIGQVASDAIHGHGTSWQDAAGAFARGAAIGAVGAFGRRGGLR